MSAQPEALRLANSLAAHSLSRHGQTQAAAELRRLHAENEALQNTKHYEAPPGFVLNPDYLVPELRAQRDALLEALKLALRMGQYGGVSPRTVEDAARAAIRAVEEQK